MELPARLCGLWALLFCAASCGNTAPTGECSPPAWGKGRSGARPAGGRGRDGAEGCEGSGRRSLSSQHSTLGNGSLRHTLPGGGPRGARAFPIAGGDAEREDKESTPHFRCAFRKAKEPGAGARD